jgi:ribosomal protein S18 acetylase RimI-like enzyme
MIYHIEDAPPIPGLNFRPYQGVSDNAELAAVLTASEASDHMDRHVNADDIGRAFQNLSNCNPYKDLIIAVVGGKVVGYTRGWWEDGPFPQRWYAHNGFLIPEWRRKGIGRALLDGMEQHLREIASTHPPEFEKNFQVNVTQFQVGTAALLVHSGYQPVRYYDLMVRPTLDDIPEIPLPDGLEIRPVLPEHFRPIWQLVVETSQEEWGHTQPTEDDYQEWLESPEFQPDLWQVAWEITANQIVGQVLTFIHHAENNQFNRQRGYTENIGVTRSWRRRGVASALISRSLLAQKAAGMTESALVVDTDNLSGASHLDESCGFQIVKRDTLYSKPLNA